MTTPTIPVTPEEAYGALAATVRDLGRVLSPACSARFDVPPGATVGLGHDGLPGDPTGDTVLDRRRWELSAAVTDTSFDLRRADALLRKHVRHLTERLAAWEGCEGGPENR